MTRQKVLRFYKDILKTIRTLPIEDREFVRKWARTDLEKYRNEVDQERILSLLSQGI